MDYESADDQLFSAFEAEAKDLLASVGRTKFKNTYRALFGFVFKTNSLKTALFDCIESENPYVFRIVFRCLCEHYLKFTHIFMRFLEEQNDDVGTDFFAYCGASEAKDYAKSLNLAESLIGSEYSIDFDHLVKKYYPKAANLSSRSLEAKSAEFRYREILRRLAKKRPELISKEIPFLASIVPAYAEYSAFVHGGPMADSHMTMFGAESEIMHCRETAGLAFTMVATIYAFTTRIVAQEFEEFTSVARKIEGILRSYVQADDEG